MSLPAQRETPVTVEGHKVLHAAFLPPAFHPPPATRNPQHHASRGPQVCPRAISGLSASGSRLRPLFPLRILRPESAIDIDNQTLYFSCMTAVTVSSKYQIVIPQEARQKLGIRSGTKLQAISEQSGLRLVKEPSIDEISGLLAGLAVRDAEIRDEEDRRLP